jgi:hypothetical protein
MLGICRPILIVGCNRRCRLEEKAYAGEKISLRHKLIAPLTGGFIQWWCGLYIVARWQIRLTPGIHRRHTYSCPGNAFVSRHGQVHHPRPHRERSTDLISDHHITASSYGTTNPSTGRLRLRLVSSSAILKSSYAILSADLSSGLSPLTGLS